MAASRTRAEDLVKRVRFHASATGRRTRVQAEAVPALCWARRRFKSVVTPV